MAGKIVTQSSRNSVLLNAKQGGDVLIEVVVHGRLGPCLRLTLGAETSYVTVDELREATRLLGIEP